MRQFAISLLLLLTAAAAFGHAGEVHKYMGTIAAVNDDGSYTLDTTDGKSIRFLVSKDTTYVHADGTKAGASDLTVGKRAVVTVATDGKTATMVKLGAARK
jgi:hypothetical protein